MADPPALGLTTLTAVNELLRAIGLREVSAYSDTSDSLNAYRALSNANVNIQSEGWLVNTQNQTPALNAGPDPAAGTVTIPANYLLVRPRRDGNVWPKYLSVRSGLLYNLTDSTAVFTEAPELEVIMALDFADMPPALKWYITCTAGKAFMPATYPTPESYYFTQQMLEDAAAKAAHEDEILRDGALYETSPHFRGMRQR